MLISCYNQVVCGSGQRGIQEKRRGSVVFEVGLLGIHQIALIGVAVR